jgi:hypothetical protein
MPKDVEIHHATKNGRRCIGVICRQHSTAYELWIEIADASDMSIMRHRVRQAYLDHRGQMH